MFKHLILDAGSKRRCTVKAFLEPVSKCCRLTTDFVFQSGMPLLCQCTPESTSVFVNNIVNFFRATGFPEYRKRAVFPNVVSFASADTGPLISALLDIFDRFFWSSVVVIHDSFPPNVFYKGFPPYLVKVRQKIGDKRMIFTSLEADSSKPIPYETLLAKAIPISRGKSSAVRTHKAEADQPPRK